MEALRWAAATQLAPLLSSELMCASRSMGSEMARPLAGGRDKGVLEGRWGAGLGQPERPGCELLYWGTGRTN